MATGDGNDAIKDPKKSDESKHGHTDPLVKLAGKGPIWLRALALVALILSSGTPYWQRINEYLDDQHINDLMQTVSATVKSSTVYAGGTPIAAPPDALKQTANALSPEDAKHLSWHTSIKMETPSFKRLMIGARKGVIAYSVYPSDGCILINHIANGFIKTDLVRAEEELPTGNSARERPEIDWDNSKLKLDVDWAPEPTVQLDTPNKTPIQGSCINPHPGQFGTWSVPVNQCIEQFFRRFADGCTHYQMHNRCNNMWDPEIHWTFCNAQHAW